MSTMVVIRNTVAILALTGAGICTAGLLLFLPIYELAESLDK